MSQNKSLKLGKLHLQPVEPAQLAQFYRGMQTVTLPKVREDVERQRRNVTIARTFVAR
jgi:hypothetical protein